MHEIHSPGPTSFRMFSSTIVIVKHLKLKVNYNQFIQYFLNAKPCRIILFIYKYIKIIEMKSSTKITEVPTKKDPDNIQSEIGKTAFEKSNQVSHLYSPR